jgi:putative sugar O-methyltransferase
MTDWQAMTKRTLAGLETCDAIYRPTNFWRPGVRQLLDDLEANGLDSFKSWAGARFWFYPTYGHGFVDAAIDSTFDFAATANPAVEKPWFRSALSGTHQARRDFDAARLAWDQSRWPFDIEGLGESEVGKPPEFYRLDTPHGSGWTRPYLNYLLCLAALSRHVDAPPRRFLEIGGGFGVLGEIVMSRDPEARYVNLDLPPLMTVSSYYLNRLFDGRVALYDHAIADTGPLVSWSSGCLPNWRIGDIAGDFDVFFNAFSFQEMEPEVVAHYISKVAAMRVPYALSLNSRRGKPRARKGQAIGVVDPVTSGRIVSMFEDHGYELLARYGNPLLQSAAELVILRRKGLTSRPPTALAARPDAALNDYRIRPIGASRSTTLRTFAHEWVPPKILRGMRRVRRWMAAR